MSVGRLIEAMTPAEKDATLAYLAGYAYSLLRDRARLNRSPAAIEVHLAALAIADPLAADLVRAVGE